MENEDAFAAEARDDVTENGPGRRRLDLTGSRNRRSTPERGSLDDGESLEESPLLPSKSLGLGESGPDRYSEGYERAINEPWRGARGSEGLPWYKKPSVSGVHLGSAS